jgi:hypothetical protein
MAYVTTGKTGDEATAVLVSGEDEATAEHMTADQARWLGIRLIEAAHRLENPTADSEWP